MIEHKGLCYNTLKDKNQGYKEGVIKVLPTQKVTSNILLSLELINRKKESGEERENISL